MKPSAVITAPVVEPVTVEALRAHARIATTEDDPQIAAMLLIARKRAEDYLGRSLITQTREVYMDTFPMAIALPYGPVASVTSVKYYDTNNVEQTLSSTNYILDAKAETALIFEAVGYTWPATYDRPNAVTVRYVAGYGAAPSTVPEAIRQWILMHAAALYETRETVTDRPLMMPRFAEGLLDPYRVSYA